MLWLMFLGQILSMLYCGTLDNRNILSASFELKRLVALLTNDWSTFPAVPPWVRWFKPAGCHKDHASADGRCTG